MLKGEYIPLTPAERAEIISKKFTILDVGCGDLPLPHIVRGRKEGIYIGIDVDQEALEKNKAKLRQKNAFFVNAKGEEVPLPERSADLIYFVNIFGDDDIPVESKLSFIKEAERVIKLNGTVLVLEFYTPNEAKHLWVNGEQVSLTHLFKQKGFSQTRFEQLKETNPLYQFVKSKIIDFVISKDKNPLYKPFIFSASKATHIHA